MPVDYTNKLFKDYSDIYKFKLIRKISIFICCAFAFLSIAFYSVDSVSFGLYVLGFCVSGCCLYYLETIRNHSRIYWIYTSLATIVMVGLFVFYYANLQYQDLLWMICIILLAFIGLKRIHAIQISILLGLAMVYYLVFRMDAHHDSFHINSLEEIIAGVTETIVALGLIVFILHSYITCHDKMNKELFGLQSKYRSVLHNMNDALIHFDHRGKIVFWNDKIPKLLGFSEEELKNLKITDVITKQQFKMILRRYLQQLKGTLSHESFELSLTKKDGSIVWTELHISPIADKNELTGTEVLIRNITRRKMHYLELSRINRELINIKDSERERIAYELHDGLNQILVAARINLQMMDHSDKQIRVMEIIDSAIEESRNISNNLVPKDLLESGLITAIENLIEKCGSFSSSELNITDEARERMNSMFDHNKFNLYRIVQEFLNNSSKHSDSTHIKIVFNTDGNTMNLNLSNNGNKIEEDIVKKPGSFIALKRRTTVLRGKFNVAENKEGLVRFHISFPCSTEENEMGFMFNRDFPQENNIAS